MIELSNLTGRSIFVNEDLIRSMEAGPETTLCFIDGTRIPVKENPSEITQKIIDFKLKTHQLQQRDSTSWK